MKILALSDIIQIKFPQILAIINSEKPDVVIIAGDIGGKKILEQFEKYRIKTLCVKGNWDNYTNYDSVFRLNQFQFVHDISEKYFYLNGLTFLGIPYSYFTKISNLRRIKEQFNEKFDFVVTHPPTKRRIWVFELKPKVVLMGHDDLRICKVSNSILITTNYSPLSYAILMVNHGQIKISYHQGITIPISHYRPTPRPIYEIYSNIESPTELRYEATWHADKKRLVWHSQEHYCYNPPSVYFPRDAAYGNMLEILMLMKNTKSKSQILNELSNLAKLRIPKTLLNEYLGLTLNSLEQN